MDAFEITVLRPLYQSCTLMSWNQIQGGRRFDCVSCGPVHFKLDSFGSTDANFVLIMTRDLQFAKITWSAFGSIEQWRNVENLDVGGGM